MLRLFFHCVDKLTNRNCHIPDTRDIYKADAQTYLHPTNSQPGDLKENPCKIDIRFKQRKFNRLLRVFSSLPFPGDEINE